MNCFKRLLSMLAVLAVAACGGGGGNSGNSPFGGGSGSGGGAGGTGGTGTTPVLTMDVKLLDTAGAVTSSVSAGQPVRAQATVKLNGVAVPNQLVQFSAEQSVSLVKIDPSAGSQLTDASGTAVVTVSSLGTESGAGRIVATATASGLTATSSANFFASAVSTTPPASLVLSALQIGSTSVSAYGTTGVKVGVLQGTTPYTAGVVTVNFTTSCPAGKATITPSATTQPDGSAVATFVDNGCAQTADTTVTITASIATDSKSGTMTVRSPSTGSLRFVSVVPSDKSITLRGQGGNGRQENAAVTFQLVDVAGQGVGNADVCFDSSTYVGGLNIDGFGPGVLPAQQGSTALCGTDALSVVRYVKRTNPDGTVVVQINSGTIPTPVRVRARALYPSGATAALETFSDTLSVSTGLPLQRSFSLSVEKANIDGGDFDGVTSTLTARLADQFSNPVPDGTVVNFIGSGGAVCTANNGSCKTVNGACSCQFVSQARRPADGRVVVTAYAVGLEDYDERDGDNVYSAGVDAFNLATQDLGDAYVDANKDGIPNSQTINGDTDILIPYQQPNVFTATGDGKRGTAHIRASTIIYLSRSSSNGNPTAVVPLSDLSQANSLVTAGVASTYFLRMQPNCPSGSVLPQAGFTLFLEDGTGNPMAAGTSVSVANVSNNLSAGSFLPGSVLAIGARPPSPLLDLPNTIKLATWTTTNANSVIPTGHGITVKGVEGKCSGNASFAVQVTSPLGGAGTTNLLFEGEPRSVTRASMPIRYADLVGFTVVSNSSKTATLTPGSWVGPAGGPTAAKWTIDWGDGTVTAPIATPMQPPYSHLYTSAGGYSVTLTITAGGSSYSTTNFVVVQP